MAVSFDEIQESPTVQPMIEAEALEQFAPDLRACAYSIAISLKRIADMVDGTALGLAIAQPLSHRPIRRENNG